MSNEILVCTDCNDWQVKKIGDNPRYLGKELTTELIHHSTEPLSIEITPTKCLGACSKSCVIAFRGKDKPTYIFSELAPENAVDILKLAEVYVNGDGAIQWSDRPDCLKQQIARLPI